MTSVLQEVIHDMRRAVDDVTHEGIAHGEERDFGVPVAFVERVRTAMSWWDSGTDRLTNAVDQLEAIADEIENPVP